MTNKTEQLSTVGGRLKFLREDLLDLSRPVFGALVGIPAPTIKNYESLDRQPSVSLAHRLEQCTATANYTDWVIHGTVERPVQIDPVRGVHSHWLLERLTTTIGLFSKVSMVPSDLLAQIRAVLPGKGESSER